MPLSDQETADDACSGTVAATYEDLDQVQDEIEAFLQATLVSCVRHLPGFKDRSINTVGESQLCEGLCFWINAFAYGQALFRFFPEISDSGHGGRAPDLTVAPAVGPTAVLKVGVHDYDCAEFLYIIEAKRLPPPPSTAEEDRSREYVVSDWNHRASLKKSRTGGIERFKELLHGRDFVRAGMIGFVQAETPDHWFTAINSWIRELMSHAIPRHRARWVEEDLLSPLANQATTLLSQYESRHVRVPNLNPIVLRHFWLVLT